MFGWGRNKPTAKTVDVTIPSGQTVDLQGLETWQVTWQRRYSMGMGFRHTGNEPVGQLFTNEQDAQDFAKALRNAYALVRNTIDPEGIKVERVSD
jgi:hypothetical protein